MRRLNRGCWTGWGTGFEPLHGKIVCKVPAGIPTKAWTTLLRFRRSRLNDPYSNRSSEVRECAEMMKCEDISWLVSHAHDRPLKFRERMSLRIHLWLCGNCRRFEQQIRLLRQGLGRLADRSGTAGADRALSDEARDRIQRALAGEANDDQ